MTKNARTKTEWDASGFEWEGECKDAVIAGTNKAKEERKAASKRSYHIAMFMFDTVIAIVCLMTIVGIPFAMLFGYFAMKRYDKYLK